MEGGAGSAKLATGDASYPPITFSAGLTAARSPQCARDDGWNGSNGQGRQSFTSHDICELVPHVPGIRTQNLNNGIFEKNKAIVITRSNQEPRIDYSKSFVPVIGLGSPYTSIHSGYKHP